ncbi:MAG: hypothetical protein DWQ07_22250 [Chloroflexi bacterium]|nr:MAG: hypothetical protein DWQ07_22250 [Chloroflexota bacterium]MBL1193870.1 hypothetical protein [Chloroflexota bacterium]NOH11164.1 hypothetical protein [Chloroflexota bacterium]
MTLNQLLVFTTLALIAAPFFNSRWRGWTLMIGSVAAIYWLQPSTPIRNLDFWLPTATLGLTVLVWSLTREKEQENGPRADLIAGIVLLVTVLAIAAMRFLPFQITPSRPPQLYQVLIALVVLAAIGLILWRTASGKALSLNIGVASILLLFIVLKSHPLAENASAAIRGLTGQSTDLANAFDIRWLGFSYVAFRLLHTLRDRLSGRLPNVSLRDFTTYVIFFPAFTAGPIDRVERFIGDLENDFRLDASQTILGLKRIAIGVLMKFVVADSLALFALDPNNVFQTESTTWMWVLLYSYSLRIFFDFAGYTHIAIGIANLLSIQLPENFDRPYLKANLTAFWNSWHMTLAQWFRAYYFNPLTRWLRGRGWSITAIILIGQLTTMALIGLWHGVTWNFLIWGLWHGLGLFLHNRWADFAKSRITISNQAIANIGGALLTFHFVVLGWLWFALPELEQSLYALGILFGGGV